eukprot:218188_1
MKKNSGYIITGLLILMCINGFSCIGAIGFTAMKDFEAERMKPYCSQAFWAKHKNQIKFRAGANCMGNNDFEKCYSGKFFDELNYFKMKVLLTLSNFKTPPVLVDSSNRIAEIILY